MIALIFAQSENGVIGRDGELPWHLPADLQRFKALTTRHTLIMGRRTYDSIGRPLPNRRSIVITRNRELRIPGAEIAHTWESAMTLSTGDVYVIGGAAIYRMAFPHADRVYRTVVHATVDGDVLLDTWDMDGWELLERDARSRDDRHAYDFTFETWVRTASHSPDAPGPPPP